MREPATEPPDRLVDGPPGSSRDLFRCHGHGAADRHGHFTQVETGDGVMLDFADTNAEPSSMHLAFLVTERQFDQIFDRITERAMPYWADPRRSEPDQINHGDGGRGVYFGDAHTNVGWEIITRPYGSGPRTQQTDSIGGPRLPAEGEEGDD